MGQATKRSSKRNLASWNVLNTAIAIVAVILAFLAWQFPKEPQQDKPIKVQVDVTVNTKK